MVAHNQQGHCDIEKKRSEVAKGVWKLKEDNGRLFTHQADVHVIDLSRAQYASRVKVE